MRVKLLMVSAGAALVMALTACGSPDPDKPADPPGIAQDDPGDGGADTSYDEGTGDGDAPYGGSGDADSSYGVPEQQVPDESLGEELDDFYQHQQIEDDLDVDPQGLSDHMYDNFQHNMGNYQGW